MKIGTAEAAAGERDSGYKPVTELPTGHDERVPVVVVNGADPGPTLWVTGTIHGDEPTGIITIHELLATVRAEELSGALVCVPGMNPAGIRTNARTSYYHDDDPNRYFGRANDSAPPRVQQRIDERLYRVISATADALVSVHTSWIATHPYAIQPRVPYGAERSREAATELLSELSALTDAFGFPVVNGTFQAETDPGATHNTLTGTAVADGIPAFTPELGGRFVVDRDVCAAAVSGLQNVLHALGMTAEPVAPAEDFALGCEEPHTLVTHPHTDTAGLVRYRVTEGDPVSAGQVVAEIRTPHGERKAEVVSDHDGYVLSRYERVAVYENDPLLDIAVPDDSPRVVRAGR